MEHLTNCHGEWVALTAVLSSVPILRMWLKSRGGEGGPNADG